MYAHMHAIHACMHARTQVRAHACLHMHTRTCSSSSRIRSTSVCMLWKARAGRVVVGQQAQPNGGLRACLHARCCTHAVRMLQGMSLHSCWSPARAGRRRCMECPTANAPMHAHTPTRNTPTPWCEMSTLYWLMGRPIAAACCCFYPGKKNLIGMAWETSTHRRSWLFTPEGLVRAHNTAYARLRVPLAGAQLHAVQQQLHNNTRTHSRTRMRAARHAAAGAPGVCGGGGPGPGCRAGQAWCCSRAR